MKLSMLTKFRVIPCSVLPFKMKKREESEGERSRKKVLKSNQGMVQKAEWEISGIICASLLCNKSCLFCNDTCLDL